MRILCLLALPALAHLALALALTLPPTPRADGDHDGTCATVWSSLGIIAPGALRPGTCAGYYEQVTTYCCHSLNGSEQTAAHVLDNGQTVNYSTCAPTGSFKNMLSCFQKATSEHCADSALVFPTGLCTSTDASLASPSSSASSSNPACSLVPPLSFPRGVRGVARGAAPLPLCLLLLLNWASLTLM